MTEQTRTSLPGFVRLSLFAAVGAAVGGLAGCSSNSSNDGQSPSTNGSIGCTRDPRGEDFKLNLTHKGDSGMLSFVIIRANDNPPVVDDNMWTLKVLDANGQPVSDANLSLPQDPSDPWMPDHTHGAFPGKAVNNKDGTYTITPLYFSMSGIWSTHINATVGSVTDSTTFTFCISS